MPNYWKVRIAGIVAVAEDLGVWSADLRGGGPGQCSAINNSH